MKRILFLLIIVILTPGCLILPVSGDHQQEIDKVQNQIAVGKTTREEVISILGEPDVTEDRSISYFNKEYDGGWFWLVVIPSEGDAGISGQKYMDLYFEFDNYGVLTDFRTNTTEKLQCVNKVVICVQECSERFGNNPGIEASDKAACSFDCDEALKVCFASFERDKAEQ